jgi:hypothetical protein
MREDQYLKLQALTEKLLDVAVVDIDPANWTAYKVAPIEMTQQQRGDAYWCKKNAIATIGVIMRVESLIGRLQYRETPPPPAEGAPPADDAEQSLRDELETEIKSAETQAAALLKQFEKRHGAKAQA